MSNMHDCTRVTISPGLQWNVTSDSVGLKNTPNEAAENKGMLKKINHDNVICTEKTWNSFVTKEILTIFKFSLQVLTYQKY